MHILSIALRPFRLNRKPVTAAQIDGKGRFSRDLGAQQAQFRLQETFTTDPLSVSCVFGKPPSPALSGAANGR